MAMPRFDPETAVEAMALQQLVTEWCRELDDNHGLGATRFFTEDCVVDAGPIAYRGHEAMREFYRGVAEFARATPERGARTTRHTYTSLGISFSGRERATVTFLSFTFSGYGETPVVGATAANTISDVRFECRRDEQRDWRVAEFYASPVFLGDDPYLNQLMNEDR
jgi:hypothetical protein